MGTTSSFFGGGGGGAVQPVFTSFNARKKLTHKATTTNISGQSGNLGAIFLCPINDTHFIVHYNDSSQNLAYARMFELNTSTFAVARLLQVAVGYLLVTQAAHPIWMAYKLATAMTLLIWVTGFLAIIEFSKLLGMALQACRKVQDSTQLEPLRLGIMLLARLMEP